ncbi:hypothetical protein [Aestuariirhabdus sp. LZHN29]|uniref:hypothetical protein n=1 Tax=Aestuariirhabdus sp. LZHN29 TaxID=3417462 RepID=UPI003CF53690
MQVRNHERDLVPHAQLQVIDDRNRTIVDSPLSDEGSLSFSVPSDANRLSLIATSTHGDRGKLLLAEDDLRYEDYASGK